MRIGCSFSIRKTARTALGFLCAAALLAASAHPSYARSQLHAPDGSYGVYVLGRIAGACGFGSNVRLCRAPVDFAQALLIDNREAIFYNPKSLDELERKTGNPWSAVSVIAHELGHHYYGHSHVSTRDVAPEISRQNELDADYFSGYALSRLGASLEDAEAAQRSLNDDETMFHPSAARRLQAIEAGWLDGCDGLRIADRPISRIDERTASRGQAARADSPGAGPEPLCLATGQW
jgi:hypothetical protein